MGFLLDAEQVDEGTQVADEQPENFALPEAVIEVKWLINGVLPIRRGASSAFGGYFFSIATEGSVPTAVIARSDAY